MTAEEMLRGNTVEYKQHLTTKNRLSRALKFQENIRAFQTIPKRYYPSTTPEIICPNTELGQSLRQNTESCFFHHLEEVIMHNTISLELEQARLKEIVQRTERQLSTLEAPTEDINKLHQQFYMQNNIHDEGTSSNIPKTEAKQKTTPQTPQKRKQSPQLDPPIRAEKSKASFFVQRPPPQTRELTLHNLSTHTLTPADYQLLDRGLTFSPTARLPPTELQLAQYYKVLITSPNHFVSDTWASLAPAADHMNTLLSPAQPHTSNRHMKFLPKPKTETPLERYTGVGKLETYNNRTHQTRTRRQSISNM